MSLADVQARISFDGLVVAADAAAINAIVANLYETSLGSVLLEKLVSDNRYIKFTYQENSMEGQAVEPGSPPQFSNIYFDLQWAEEIRMINQDGNIVYAVYPAIHCSRTGPSNKSNIRHDLL